MYVSYWSPIGPLASGSGSLKANKIVFVWIKNYFSTKMLSMQPLVSNLQQIWNKAEESQSSKQIL